MNRHSLVTLLVAGIFIVPGLFLAYYHSTTEDIPFFESGISSDLIELSATFQMPASGESKLKRRELRFRFPDSDPYWKLVDEQINSGPFSLVILQEGKSRIGILSARVSGEETLSANYRLTVKREAASRSDFDHSEESFPELSPEHQADFSGWLKSQCGDAADWERSNLQRCLPKLFRLLRDQKSGWLKEGLGVEKLSTEGFAKAIVGLFTGEGVWSRTGLAIPMRGYQSSVVPRYVLFINTEQTTELAFDFRTESVESAKSYLTWGLDPDVIKSSKGVEKVTLELATAAVSDEALGKNGAQPNSLLLRFLSIQRLPLATQALFEFTLLLPLAALVICVVRNFIGLVTFGTFLPALLGLSFMQTGLFSGFILSVLILGTGCIARLAADRLHMLLVPRLAAVLTTVTILFYLLTQLSFDLSWTPGLQVSLFPVVVLTMMVERFTLIIDELGFVTAMGRLVSTLLSAVLCYIVLAQGEIRHLFFMFPELNIAVLGVCIVFGRYSGYRLTELFRFREFGEEDFGKKLS